MTDEIFLINKLSRKVKELESLYLKLNTRCDQLEQENKKLTRLLNTLRLRVMNK